MKPIDFIRFDLARVSVKRLEPVPRLPGWLLIQSVTSTALTEVEVAKVFRKAATALLS